MPFFPILAFYPKPIYPMKYILLSAACFSFSLTEAFAQSAAPVYTESDISTMIIQQGICAHDTASFASLYRHPETHSAHGNPQRNAPQTAPLLMTNPGFETGDFTGWTGIIGDNSTSSFGPLQNMIPGIFTTITNEALSNSNARHTIMTNLFGVDPYGGFPVVAANGGNYSVRLGGTTANYQGESIHQIWNVDPGQPFIEINYAVVINSGGHPAAQSSYFKYDVLDSNGQIIATRYDGSSSPTGYLQYAPDTAIYYLPWTTDTVQLGAYAGTNVTLRFTVAGCTQSGHFGYCYVDAFYPYATSIPETPTASFSIFPNPANDIFEVSGNVNSDNGTLQLRDCLGQLVDAAITPTATGWKVDMSNKAPGIYFVEVYSGNEKSVQRLIKQ
jgi:hypothetical protein